MGQDGVVACGKGSAERRGIAEAEHEGIGNGQKEVVEKKTSARADGVAWFVGKAKQNGIALSLYSIQSDRCLITLYFGTISNCPYVA